MIRFLCREVDTGAASHVGGPADITWATFTDAAELEAWLRFTGERPPMRHATRECVGVELVPDTALLTLGAKP